jgi:hypothetical protein
VRPSELLAPLITAIFTLPFGCFLQDLRQIRTKPGQPLSALKGLDSGIMFCTYDLLTAGATPAKPKKGGKPGRPPKAAAAAATAATQINSSAAGYGMAGGSFSSAGSGRLSGGLFGGGSGSFSRSGSGSFGRSDSGSGSLWDDENQPPPWERPQSPDEDEECEPAVEEFGESEKSLLQRHVCLVCDDENNAMLRLLCILRMLREPGCICIRLLRGRVRALEMKVCTCL